MTSKITIGTDPEVFLRDKDGKFVSAHDLIPGTKDNPFPVMGGAIQVDGVAMEFNTDPASTPEEFAANIELVMHQMTLIYQTVRDDLDIAINPTATFDAEYFGTLPEEVLVLGCTPDFNAYTGKENCPPETSEPFRTGAGHFHIGWTEHVSVADKDHFDVCCRLTRALDATLFVASLLWDSDTKRRTLYGKVGSFRPKSYGCEYRPLSNAYLRAPSIQKFCFRYAHHFAGLLLDQGISLEDDALGKAFVAEQLEGVESDRKAIIEYLGYLTDKYEAPIWYGRS